MIDVSVAVGATAPVAVVVMVVGPEHPILPYFYSMYIMTRTD